MSSKSSSAKTVISDEEAEHRIKKIIKEVKSSFPPLEHNGFQIYDKDLIEYLKKTSKAAEKEIDEDDEYSKLLNVEGDRSDGKGLARPVIYKPYLLPDLDAIIYVDKNDENTWHIGSIGFKKHVEVRSKYVPKKIEAVTPKINRDIQTYLPLYISSLKNNISSFIPIDQGPLLESLIALINEMKPTLNIQYEEEMHQTSNGITYVYQIAEIPGFFDKYKSILKTKDHEYTIVYGVCQNAIYDDELDEHTCNLHHNMFYIGPKPRLDILKQIKTVNKGLPTTPGSSVIPVRPLTATPISVSNNAGIYRETSEKVTALVADMERVSSGPKGATTILSANTFKPRPYSSLAIAAANAAYLKNARSNEENITKLDNELLSLLTKSNLKTFKNSKSNQERVKELLLLGANANSALRKGAKSANYPDILDKITEKINYVLDEMKSNKKNTKSASTSGPRSVRPPNLLPLSTSSKESVILNPAVQEKSSWKDFRLYNVALKPLSPELPEESVLNPMRRFGGPLKPSRFAGKTSDPLDPALVASLSGYSGKASRTLTIHPENGGPVKSAAQAELSSTMLRSLGSYGPTKARALTAKKSTSGGRRPKKTRKRKTRFNSR